MVLLHRCTGLWRNHKASHQMEDIKLLVDEDLTDVWTMQLGYASTRSLICCGKVELCWSSTTGAASISASHLMWIITPPHFQNSFTNSVKIVSTYLLQLRHLRWTRLSAPFLQKMLEHVTDLSIGDTCRHLCLFHPPLAIWTTALTWYIWLLDICRPAAHQADVKQLSNLKTIQFIDVAWQTQALGWVSAPALQTIEVSSKRHHTPRFCPMHP